MDVRDRALHRLGELRGRFGERLRARLERLEMLVQRAHADPTAGALAEAIGAAHRLAGTAGSYGHIDVGEAAAGLERALQGIAGGQGNWDTALAALDRARAAGP